MKKLTNKILFSLFLIISLGITAISASAVTTYTEFTGQSTINEGESTTFDAVIYSMDPPIDYSIILYDSNYNALYTFEQGTTTDSLYESLDIEVNKSHYSTYGTFYIILTATDSRGDSSYSQLTLTVNQYGWPTASITDPFDGDTFIVGDTITFSGYGTDIDGTIVSYNWTSNLNGLLNSGTGDFSSFSTNSLAIGTHTITFTVVDDEGKTGSDSITINIKQLNEPTASIVSPLDGQEFKQGDTITFSGSGSDLDGNIVSYSWTSSIDGQLSTSASFQTSNLSAGTHTITFTVTDDDGLTNSDSITITVKELNAPVVSITSPNNEDDFKEGEEITFTAVASDSDGSIVSYEWVSSEDGVIGNSQTFTTSALSDGRHTITVTVTDDDGLTASYSIDITVKALTAPTAVITSPESGAVFKEGDPITFDGSQSYDEDGYITSYSWRSDKDGTIGNVAVFTKDDLSLGKHYITLTVTDNDNQSYTDTFTIWIVINPLTAPDVIINSPENGAIFNHDEQITFNASVSDPDGSIVSYSWTSDIYGEIKSGSGEPESFTSTLPEGEHEITLIVTDDNGLTGQDTVWITVAENRPPVADAGSDRTVAANSTVLFDASNSYDPDGTIVSYEWDFGDNTTATGITVTHSFDYGTYTVTLTVTDNDGATDTDTITVIADGRPTAVAGGPYTGYVNEAVTFDASQSTDDTAIISYQWDFGDGTIETTANPTITHTYDSTGNYTVTLTVTDNDGLTHSDQTYAYISVKPSEEERILKTVYIKSIDMPNGDIVEAGDTVNFNLRFKNTGDIKLKNVKATALIQELAVRDSIGPFDLKKGDERTETLSLEIPEYAEDGEYVVRLTISNNDVHRIVYRFIVVR